MMFSQEDFNAETQDEGRAVLNYISKNIEDPYHDGCVRLKLEDCSNVAEHWVRKRHPDWNYPECNIEVLVTPEEMTEIRKIMMRLLKAAEERGW